MLRIVFKNKPRNLSKAEGHCSGPQGRINKLRKLVTALVRHERIEGMANYLDESRGYAERLIQEAQKHGDTHAHTMELADYWLLEKDLIHKLFKVLAPRYENYESSFTRYHRLPMIYPGRQINLAVLELKGNPWPPVVPHVRDIRGSIVNVLLNEAEKDYKWKHKARHVSTSVDRPISSEERLDAALSWDGEEVDVAVGDPVALQSAEDKSVGDGLSAKILTDKKSNADTAKNSTPV